MGRIKFVVVLLVLAWTGLVLRLGMIQLVEGKHLEEWARREQQSRVVLEPERGSIYDRMNRLLAGSMEVSSVGAFCPAIENKEFVAGLLRDFGLGEYDEILSLLSSGSRFVWVRRSVSEKTASLVRNAKIQGISVSRDSRRHYPMGSLAGNLLGFVGEDKIGLEGIEYQFESVLGGSPGWAVLQKVSGNSYPFPDCPRKKAKRGKDMVLTIDANIQSVCEEELMKTLERFKAKYGIAVVLDPNTGEILAMANCPSYDPNLLGKGEANTWKNKAITDMFEPGSTFKIVADGVALDRSLVAAEDSIDSEGGVIRIGSLEIHDVKNRGIMTFSEAVAYSSNVVAVKVARRLGKNRMYESARAFGFGNKSGVLLPGEAKGSLAPPGEWSEIRFANVAIGQGVAVTALQLALAYASVANGGELVEPVIVKGVIDADGRLRKKSNVRVIRRVMSEEGCAKLSEVLTGVVEFGTGRMARLDGISVAGKTGTAQKAESGIGYVDDKLVCSFAGFLPAEDPKLVIVVVVDEPVGRHWGSDVAGPLFKRIAKKVIEMRPYQSEIYSRVAQLQ